MNIGEIVIPRDVPEGFALFYTTRDFRGFLDVEIGRELTRFIETRFGISASLTTCNQVHGCRAGSPTRPGGSEDPPHTWSECDSCDALYSQSLHTALGIKVADCLPVTMIDPVHSVIANIHSGWRGTAQGITSKTLDTLAGETRFDPTVSRAWLGPSIRACCFEVGEEVATQFDESYVNRNPVGAQAPSPVQVGQARAPVPPRPHLDIPAFTKDILRARGFGDDAVIDTELCTRCEGSIFHSYRREGKGGGRNLAIVAQ